MSFQHYKRGCINCGHLRSAEEMLSKEHDVYFLDQNARTLMRVGFCKDCFEGQHFDCGTIKAKLYESELACCLEHQNQEDMVDVFKCAEFVDHISWKDFWQQYDGKTVHDYIRSRLDERQ